MKDLEVKEEFLRLRARGLSYDKIARQLEVSKPTLLKWAAELHDELADAKIIEMDGVLEELGLAKRERVKAFASMLKRVLEEVAARDLTEVKTEKLVEMALDLKADVEDELRGLSRDVEVGEPVWELGEDPKRRKVNVSALD